MWHLRTAKPTDVDALQRFVGQLSLATRVQRFFAPLRELPGELVRALRQADPTHRFVIAEAGAEPIALGQLAVRGTQGEVALVVADGWQSRGVGTRLLARLLDEAVRHGLREVLFETLASNRGMCALARRAGFTLQRHPGDPELLLGRRGLTACERLRSAWAPWRRRALSAGRGPAPHPPAAAAACCAGEHCRSA